jgi:hypothetical protein
MRGVLRAINVLIGLVTLASALAVLASNLLEPGYAEAHGDLPWFVVLYAAVQVAIVVAFARDGWLVPWVAVAKAVAAYAFLLTLAPVGRAWMAVSPARYVYQLFDWGEGNELILLAMLFLGRGVWNTFNVFFFLGPRLVKLRADRPLLGRLATALPIAIVLWCVWTFTEFVRVADARNVARLVSESLDCEAIRARRGETTTDVRQRGKRRYTVRIVYGCPTTRVLVADDRGRVGTVASARPECCATGG